MPKHKNDLVTSVRRPLTALVGFGFFFITVWSALNHYYGSFQGGLAWLNTSKSAVQQLLEHSARQLEYQAKMTNLVDQKTNPLKSPLLLENTRSLTLLKRGGSWRVVYDLTPPEPPRDLRVVDESDRFDRALLDWVAQRSSQLALKETKSAYLKLNGQLYQAGLYRDHTITDGIESLTISIRLMDDHTTHLLQAVTAVEFIRADAQGAVESTTLSCEGRCDPQRDGALPFSIEALDQSRYIGLSLRSPYRGAYKQYHVGEHHLSAFSDVIELRGLSGQPIGSLWLVIPEDIMLYWPKIGIIGMIVFSLFLFIRIRVKLTQVLERRLSPITEMVESVDELNKSLVREDSSRSDTQISPITPVSRSHDEVTKLRDMLKLLRDQIERNEGLSHQLRQSQKMEVIGTLAGGVAHDFNNLMSVMLFNSECLRESFEALISAPDSPERLKVPEEDLEEWSELTQEMLAACEQAKVLTRQLLSISRDQRQRERAFSVDECVAEVQSLNRRLISESIRFTVSMNAPDLWVFGNDNALKQALMNVIINARDALDGAGQITINIKQHQQERAELTTAGKLKVGDYVLFRVHDTGSGIPQENIEHLFTPFFSSKGARGTGLGLTIVYRTIIERMRGAIRVTSSVGEGSSFELFIPCAAPQRQSIRPVTLPVSESQVSAERIVVVEDHDIVRRTLTSTLKGLGFQVRDFASGVEFIQWFEQNSTQVDLVLSDVVMPDMSGPEVWSIIKESYPQLPFIFLTGYTGEAIERYSVPPEMILSKPISTSELKEKLLEVLGTSEGTHRVPVNQTGTPVS